MVVPERIKKVSRVVTGSRLHFGLISIDPKSEDAFSGLGVMVAQPELVVEAQCAAVDSFEGKFRSRVGEILRSWREAVASGLLKRSSGTELGEGVEIRVDYERCDHIGLGTGTQLTVAAVSALNALFGVEITDLHWRDVFGRAKRSVVGLRGFQEGGFWIDRLPEKQTAKLRLGERYELPSSWRVALIIDRQAIGMHGEKEYSYFRTHQSNKPGLAEELRRLVEQEIRPGLTDACFEKFAAGLGRFNALSGEHYREWQGGVYCNDSVAAVVEFVRTLGISGVGQSSWGPTVFAFFECEEEMLEQLPRISARFPTDRFEQILTSPKDSGAAITTSD